MFVVVVRKKIFSSSSHSYVERDYFYSYDSEQKATAVAETISRNPMVVSAIVSEVRKKYVKGTDIYGRE